MVIFTSLRYVVAPYCSLLTPHLGDVSSGYEGGRSSRRIAPASLHMLVHFISWSLITPSAHSLILSPLFFRHSPSNFVPFQYPLQPAMFGDDYIFFNNTWVLVASNPTSAPRPRRPSRFTLRTTTRSPPCTATQMEDMVLGLQIAVGVLLLLVLFLVLALIVSFFLHGLPSYNLLYTQ